MPFPLTKVLQSQLTGLAPWIAFSLISGPDRLEEAVLLALATALVIFVLNRLQGDSFKALELSDVVFFAGLALVVAFAGSSTHKWLETWSGEISNVALVLIAVGSMLLQKPFTLPYAREEVDPAHWTEPEFIRANYVITAAWALAFAVAAISGAYGDGVLHDSDNLWTNWIIQAVALIWAARFTRWYADRAHALARRAAGVETAPPPAVPDLVKSFMGFTSIGTLFHVWRGKARH